jgi:preprotein translocase subunit YajC
MNINLKPELLALILILVIFWYFNIRRQDVLTIKMPPETMKNISIFNGDKLNIK